MHANSCFFALLLRSASSLCFFALLLRSASSLCFFALLLRMHLLLRFFALASAEPMPPLLRFFASASAETTPLLRGRRKGEGRSRCNAQQCRAEKHHSRDKGVLEIKIILFFIL
jgi:hypothetical protein